VGGFLREFCTKQKRPKNEFLKIGSKITAVKFALKMQNAKKSKISPDFA